MSFDMNHYESYVSAQCQKHPCLSGLSRFMSEPDYAQRPCRISSLEFGYDRAYPSSRSLELHELQAAVTQDVVNRRADILGRVVIIEDLSPEIVKMLGSCLHIDPLFFASHLNTPDRDIARQTPDLATRPSRMRHERFIHIQYHRMVVLQNGARLSAKKLRDMNVGRKVVQLPSIRGTYVAVVQHGCSVLKEMKKGQSWLCMIDPKTNWVCPMGGS